MKGFNIPFNVKMSGKYTLKISWFFEILSSGRRYLDTAKIISFINIAWMLIISKAVMMQKVTAILTALDSSLVFFFVDISLDAIVIVMAGNFISLSTLLPSSHEREVSAFSFYEKHFILIREPFKAKFLVYSRKSFSFGWKTFFLLYYIV